MSLPRLTPFHSRMGLVDPSNKAKKPRSWTFRHPSGVNREDSESFKQWLPADNLLASSESTPANIPHVPTTKPAQAPPGWTMPEIDSLLELAQRFDYRWPVVADRWPHASRRSVVELRAQFYSMAVFTTPFTFDSENERIRLSQLDSQFRRSRASEENEKEIMMKLKVIDEKLSNSSVRRVTPKLEIAAKTPEDRGVNLRSARLETKPNSAVGLGPRLTEKMVEMLNLLEVPAQPMPTTQVCDAHDALRRDIIRLFALRKEITRMKAKISKLPQPVAVASPVNSVTDASATTSQDLKRRASSAGLESSKKMKH